MAKQNLLHWKIWDRANANCYIAQYLRPHWLYITQAISSVQRTEDIACMQLHRLLKRALYSLWSQISVVV